jgi:hypothetical protein
MQEYSGLNRTEEIKEKILKPLMRRLISLIKNGSITIELYSTIYNKLMEEYLKGGGVYKLWTIYSLSEALAFWLDFSAKNRYLETPFRPIDWKSFLDDVLKLLDKTYEEIFKGTFTSPDLFKKKLLVFRLHHNFLDLLNRIDKSAPDEALGKPSRVYTRYESLKAEIYQDIEGFLFSGGKKNYSLILKYGLEDKLKTELIKEFEGKTLKEAKEDPVFYPVFKEEIENICKLRQKFMNATRLQEKLEYFRAYEDELKLLGLKPHPDDYKILKSIEQCKEKFDKLEKDLELSFLTGDGFTALKLIEEFKNRWPSCAEFQEEKLENLKAKAEDLIKQRIKELKKLIEEEKYIEVVRELRKYPPSFVKDVYNLLQKKLRIGGTLKVVIDGNRYEWFYSNSFTFGRVDNADWNLETRLISRVLYKFFKKGNDWYFSFKRIEGDKPAHIKLNGQEFKTLNPLEEKEIKLPPKGEIEINTQIWVDYAITNEGLLKFNLRVNSDYWKDYLDFFWPDWKKAVNRKILLGMLEF